MFINHCLCLLEMIKMYECVRFYYPKTDKLSVFVHRSKYKYI